MAKIGDLSYTVGTTTCSIYSTLTELQTDGVTYKLKVWVSSGDTLYSGLVRYTSTQQVSVSVSGLTPNTYYTVNTRLCYLPTGGTWEESGITKAGGFTTRGQTTYSYYLTLWGNGGTWNGQSYLEDYDTSTSTSYTFYLNSYTQPTRSGYAFKGWYTASSGGSQITTRVATSSNPSVEAYAQWTPYHSVQLGKNIAAGGTVSGAGSYLEGNTATITASANSGYVFDYWYDSSSTIISYNSSYSFTVTADVRYYAHFTQTLTTYYLTYQPNGGTGSAITDTIQGTPSSTGYITANLRGATFTKPYATQSGWHTSDSTEYALNGVISINSDTTVYASWSHDTTTNFYWLGSDSADWNSTTGITQSAAVTNMTATAWKGIGTKIRALQTLLGDTPSTFTTSMQSGDVIEADFYNEVTDALNEIVDNHSLNIAVPNDTAKGNVLFYYLFNGGASIKACLNNIIAWYNTR